MQRLLDTDVIPDPLAVLAVDAVIRSDEDTSVSEKIKKLRRETILQEYAAMVALLNNALMESLLTSILSQKIAYLLKATTIEEIKEICEQQKPRYNGANIINAHKYPIHEEELIGWSLTSLKAPLIEKAMERMEEVFTQVFGKDNWPT